MSVLDSFDQWKNFLAERVHQAEKMGMNDDTIQNVAYQLGDYLSQQVDPKNNEERLLKELWEAGSEDDQKTLAKLMVKMVDNQ
ncbi:DUF3243 domain-containing protein [Microaerobacter geothermalis]|uniref:DUF3243 domain-containing protein n=1 Tax=Microaerobacter geothermalis TaxID=674972 RepID=UPI001F251042|nr:DUF3243 domain-containing protein [Microaerobacter geothermalis]MCF6093158.1 DUF3243 domain-containing protein [Microaerobacter geothermalis]